MARPELRGSIEIAADEEFQRKAWRVQRVGWAVMLTVAIAALFGAFGGGPAASMKLGGIASGFTMRYERFVRMNAPQEIEFELGSATGPVDSAVQIWLDRSWVDSNKLSSITPAPESSRLLADRIIYTFAAQRSVLPLRVRFDLQSRKFGVLHGRAGVHPGPGISFTQLAYP